ncbi:hypothetical protein IQ06DRAFT_335287 [Phaeosphaeriaceae sp. SRC1lsM3a]|nr:hypothetical protein IQ06DRAFT_335287 [Stagonospora sp. SRC1lsM3a]
MAFTGAISGLFSCGRARKPQTREELEAAAAGTGGEGDTMRLDPEFPNSRIDATTTNVTDKEHNEHNSAPPQLSAPRFSEELFPFAAVHPVPAVPAPAPSEPTSPKLEHVPEERPQRNAERRQSSDVASKPAKGQIEHRILVTAAAKHDTKDAASELKVDHVETSFTNPAPVTKAPEATPVVPQESREVEPQVVEKVEEDVPAPPVEVLEEPSQVMPLASAPEPEMPAPTVAIDEEASAIKALEVQVPEPSTEEVQLPVAEPASAPAPVPHETTTVVPTQDVEVEEKPTVVEMAEKPSSRTAPTLLTLPLEVRKVIYAHMTEDAPIRMCRHDDPALAESKKTESSLPARQFYNLTQVCHQLRNEFLPIYRQQAKYIIDLWTQRTTLTKIDALKGDVAMDIDAACFDMQPIDLLPLIRYLARSGRTDCRFASTEGVVFKSIESTVEQLNKLLPSQRKNDAWLAAVNGPMKRVDLHLFPHDDIRQYYRFRGAEPMLRIVYPSAVIESWMKQSHNTGAEYEEYLHKFGLSDLEMHVVVGHASRRKTNEGRMPLDWRLSYVGSRLSLDQAVRISGTFSRS